MYLEIIKNIVPTKPTSNSKINDVLDVHRNFVKNKNKLVR